MTALSCPAWTIPPSDLVELPAYIAALDELENRDTIPAVVLGVARHVIASRPPSLVNRVDVLATLGLVTDDFWRAAADVMDGFDWPIRHPNDVRCGTADFGLQWDIVSGLFVVLQLAGADGSKRTDRQRRKAAGAIIVAAKKLRTALDATTGYDAYGDWLGLDTLDARGLLNAAGIHRAGDTFGVAPSRSMADDSELYSRGWEALLGLTLQDLLTEAIARTEWQAEHVEIDRRGRRRQARFVKSLRGWLRRARLISGDRESPGRYSSCKHTAAAILEARHPEVLRLKNPAR